MNKNEILEKLDQMWDESQSRHMGSGESELDFKENVSDWILTLISKPNE